MDALAQLNTALTARYAVDRELGRGGMATVYLARDLRHDRDVAIKVLHPDLAAALGGERFLSEIKTTARLQHPHILPLLDSGEAEGQLFYVMPYIRGETLRDRLTRETQLPVADALRIATEVADALASAHDAGIVHRDIKPENILLQSGHAMVADFGIALAVQHAGGARMTQTGLSLGTPQYMAPEQAMGDRGVDHRADVYALGAVTYEMLTGEPPHTGANAQAIVAKLLTEPVRSARVLRPAVSESMDAALLTALEKLPADRFGSVRELSQALRGEGSVSTSVRMQSTRGVTAVTPRVAPRAARLLSASGFLVAAAIGGAWVVSARRPDTHPVVRFALVYPRTQSTLDLVQTGTTVAISPQGDRIAYLAIAPGGGAGTLWVRATNDLTSKEVVTTAISPRTPCFSPDGQWIAFTDGTDVRKVSVDGGPVVTLATLPSQALGLSWGPNGVIVAGRVSGALVVINENGGGRVDSLAKTDSGGPARWPVFAPGGKTVVYGRGAAGGIANMRLAVATIDGGAVTTIDGPEGQGSTPVGFLDGKLVYVTATGALMAVPFDVGKRAITGSAVPMGEGIVRDGSGGVKASLSATGTLVYRSGRSQTVPVIARGSVTPMMADSSQELGLPRFSPDGKRVAFTVTGRSTDVWVYDRMLTTFTKVTSDGVNQRPEWSPDGKRVVFVSDRGPKPAIWWQLADASAPAELLFTPPEGDPYEAMLSPDGKWLIYRTGPAGKPARSILAVPLEGSDRKPIVLVTGHFRAVMPRISPDGRWMAYQTDESSTTTYEVYVRPFPGDGSRQQVSAGGGIEPLWSKAGNALFYRTPQGVMSVSVTTGAAFAVTGPRTLRVSGDFLTNPSHQNYDVSPDGSEFLLIRRAGEDVQTIVVENWGRELRERMANRSPR
jgi:serine/threonine-protein kinase